jgi:tRNA (Thr-GGU) A37 N-methylase
VIGGRIEPTDDYWGGSRAIIRIDSSRFDADATAGLDTFSHLEIVYRFHLTTRPTSTSAHADHETTRTGPKSASSAIATCAG